MFLKKKKPLTPQKSAVNRDQWHFRNAISEGLHRNQQRAKYFTFHSLCPCSSTIPGKKKNLNLLLTFFEF